MVDDFGGEGEDRSGVMCGTMEMVAGGECRNEGGSNVGGGRVRMRLCMDMRAQSARVYESSRRACVMRKETYEV